MTFHVERATEVLRATPGVLRAMVGALDESWTHARYGPDTFSPFDVVGHLIHGERTDWMVRLRVILEHGESRTFEPFDRYAMFEASRGKSMIDLLDTFSALRRDNLAELERWSLTEAMLDRRGTHPALGPVTLRQLLATWVVHDLNHIHQIAKAMAYQYRDEVGPWRAYVSILPA